MAVSASMWTFNLLALPLAGCQFIPEMTKTIDDIATDDAITIKVDRDAVQSKKDINITVSVVGQK